VEDSAKNMAWTRSFYDALRPHLLDKAFPNLMGQDEMANRQKQAYGPNFTRLAEIKKKYDPTNFFRLNMNIRPA
jgi:hypothetical protein